MVCALSDITAAEVDLENVKLGNSDCWFFGVFIVVLIKWLHFRLH